MLEIKNLSRLFGDIKAVDNISFKIDSGIITGFLGPNGAGKTTTLRMIVGYLQPSAGNIELDAVSIFENPIATSSKIGYLPEHNPLYEDMSVVETLQYVADLRKLKKSFFENRLSFVLQNCGLSEVKIQRIGTLSKGYHQRVGFAQAILHDPEILILDEPTSGLDPNQILEIRNLIRELGKEKTVILSSHIMQEVQALCDRVVIINKGKIIVDDAIEKINDNILDFHLLHVEIEGEDVDFADFFAEYSEVTLESMETVDKHSTISLKVSGERDIKHALAKFISQKGWLVLSLYAERKSLEEIFHKPTKNVAQQIVETKEIQTELSTEDTNGDEEATE